MGAATYILEDILIPEDVMLVNLVLEELSYPAQSMDSNFNQSGARQVSYAVEQRESGIGLDWIGLGKRGKGGPVERRCRMRWSRDGWIRITDELKPLEIST